MTLREYRKSKNLTQLECSSFLGIPLRTYQSYENDAKKLNTMKYKYMVQQLQNYGAVDETHGLLSIEQIKTICAKIFESYDVEYCYLFGSYAKGTPTESSDVDLLISGSTTGLKFYELVETLREGLGKKIDLLNEEQLKNNPSLTSEILKDGIKIYG